MAPRCHLSDSKISGRIRRRRKNPGGPRCDCAVSVEVWKPKQFFGNLGERLTRHEDIFAEAFNDSLSVGACQTRGDALELSPEKSFALPDSFRPFIRTECRRQGAASSRGLRGFLFGIITKARAGGTLAGSFTFASSGLRASALARERIPPNLIFARGSSSPLSFRGRRRRTPRGIMRPLGSS